VTAFEMLAIQNTSRCSKPLFKLNSVKIEHIHRKEKKLRHLIKYTVVSLTQKTKNRMFSDMWTLDQGQTQQGDWTMST
jgi:hypothetical protein